MNQRKGDLGKLDGSCVLGGSSVSHVCSVLNDKLGASACMLDEAHKVANRAK